MMNRTWTLMTLAVIVAVSSGIAWAQAPAPPAAPPAGSIANPSGPPSGPEKPLPEINEENRQLLKQVMVGRLTRELGLNDEQSVLLLRRFDELQTRQRELNRERTEVMRRLRLVLKQQQDEEALHRLMERLEELKRQSAAMEETIRGSFDGMDLNVWQKAKIELFINDFESQVRHIVQQARKGHLREEWQESGPERPPRELGRPGPQRPVRPPQDGPKGSPAPKPNAPGPEK